MDNSSNLVSHFDLTNLEKKYQHKRWKRAINKSRGNDYLFLLSVLKDAKEGRYVSEIGSRYYSCAKFIRDFYLMEKYKFKKEDIWYHTCCQSFPRICGGVCCCKKYNRFECSCEYIPRNSIHIDNCYEDRCNIFKFKNHHKFNLMWKIK